MIQKVLRVEQGSALIHCGKLKHGGASIASGRRYILVGFIEVESPSILPPHRRKAYFDKTDDEYIRAMNSKLLSTYAIFASQTNPEPQQNPPVFLPPLPLPHS